MPSHGHVEPVVHGLVLILELDDDRIGVQGPFDAGGVRQPHLIDQAVGCAPHPLVALLAQVCAEGDGARRDEGVAGSLKAGDEGSKVVSEGVAHGDIYHRMMRPIRSRWLFATGGRLGARGCAVPIAGSPSFSSRIADQRGLTPSRLHQAFPVAALNW